MSIWFLAYLFYIFHVVHPQSTSKFSDFGCNFDDENYNLATTWKSNWPNDPIYGNELTGPMEFKSQNEFMEFYNTAENIRMTMLESGEYIYNSMDPFIMFYNHFIASKLPFKDFYRNYAPKYPLARLNRMGNPQIGTIQLYKKLEEKFPRIRKHFILATVDQRVKEETVEKLWKSNGKQPPSDFQHQKLVGVIKFSISKVVGYLIMDIGEGLNPSVILTKDVDIQKNMGSSMRNIVQFSQGGNNSDYIMLESSKNKQFVERSVVYTRKSLCSFIQSIHKVEFLRMHRKIMKFSREGDIDFYCGVAFIPQEKKTTANLVFSKRNLKSSSKDDFIILRKPLEGFKKMNASELELAEEVAKGLLFTKDELFKSLDIMSDILAIDEQFITTLDSYYSVIVKNRNSKSFWEKTGNNMLLNLGIKGLVAKPTKSFVPNNYNKA